MYLKTYFKIQSTNKKSPCPFDTCLMIGHCVLSHTDSVLWASTMIGAYIAGRQDTRYLYNACYTGLTWQRRVYTTCSYLVLGDCTG